MLICWTDFFARGLHTRTADALTVFYTRRKVNIAVKWLVMTWRQLPTCVSRGPIAHPRFARCPAICQCLFVSNGFVTHAEYTWAHCRYPFI